MNDAMTAHQRAADEAKRPRVIWDPTVNLGVLIAAAMLTLGGVANWISVKESLATQAAKHEALAQRVAEQETRNREGLQGIRDDLREVRRGVDEVNRAMATRNRP